jgi:hypothetical protein
MSKMKDQIEFIYHNKAANHEYKSFDRSYFSVDPTKTKNKSSNLSNSFYKTKSKFPSSSISRLNDQDSNGPHFDSFLGGNGVYKSEQNLLVVDHESDHSFPSLHTSHQVLPMEESRDQKSLYEQFRTQNSPLPHQRMIKNLKLKRHKILKYPNPEIRQKKNHSVVSEQRPSVPPVDNDQYQMSQINEFQELKEALKSKIKQYKELIKARKMEDDAIHLSSQSEAQLASR